MRGFRLRASVDAAKLERARTRCATCVRSFVCRTSVAHTHTAAHQCARRARSVASSALPSFDRVLCCRARQPEPTHTRARVNQRTGSWNEATACRQPAREEPAALCARVFGLAPMSTPRNWNEPERAAWRASHRRWLRGWVRDTHDASTDWRRRNQPVRASCHGSVASSALPSSTECSVARHMSDHTNRSDPTRPNVAPRTDRQLARSHRVFGRQRSPTAAASTGRETAERV